MNCRSSEQSDIDIGLTDSTGYLLQVGYFEIGEIRKKNI